jgi:hypothetical protein
MLPPCMGETAMVTDGKVALVTGAARGIGLAAAKKFLAEGWRVALLDIDDDTLRRTMTALALPDTTLALTPWSKMPGSRSSSPCWRPRRPTGRAPSP